MNIPPYGHLAYCTNIHPAESWAETCDMLARDVLAVRDRLRESGRLATGKPFAIGLRLSARAARELIEETDGIARFRDWLSDNETYVFTINGFPYGSFHGTRVKERVFQPDWTSDDRVSYTRDLFQILAGIARPETGGSVSTLPGSHKSFRADESLIRRNLLEISGLIEDLSEASGIDLHLGLEPEPIGHFENTPETLAFFERLRRDATDEQQLGRRIGLNYDCCHFALQYESAYDALDAIVREGIRLSKTHLSSALAFDPHDTRAIDTLHGFDEPVYFHQSLLRRENGEITRFTDLPDFLARADDIPADTTEARVHFHIPLDSEPQPPLRSTRDHALDTITWCKTHPEACSHFEIETYTWAVLPPQMRRPVHEQIAAEYAWALALIR